MRTEETILNGVIVRDTVYEAEDLATQDQKVTWEAICQSCEYVQEDGTCGACGCLRESLMNLVTSVCPKNKW